MELNDNTFAFVPTAGGVVRAGMPDARVCFKLGKVPSSQQQTMEWCQLNVKRLVLGFLSLEDKTGALGANLKAAGFSARIFPVNGATLAVETSMRRTAGRWLLAAGCWLLAAGRWLLAAWP